MDGCPPVSMLREPIAQDHLALCSECREKLAALDLLDAPETADEAKALDRLTRDPAAVLAAVQLRAGRDGLRLRRRPSWAWAGAIAAAAAVVAAFVVARRPADPAEVLRDLQGPARPLEVALSDVPWQPYQPRRGPRAADFDRALGKLLDQKRPEAERALAMLYLLRGEPGDAARADQALAQAGDSAEAENDRGAAAFARGNLLSALDHFTRAKAHFNRGVTLEKLGLHARAQEAFAQAGPGPWASEPRPPPRAAPPPSGRREAYVALLAAGTPQELSSAEQRARDFPDLLALSRKLQPPELPEHAKLYALYRSLRDKAVSSADAREVEDFARLPRVQMDPLLWAPALQLVAYVHGARGEWRAVQKIDASIAGACRVRGCSMTNEAIALDELADGALRDGDYAAAARLQDRAESLLRTTGDPLPLAELHRKRASLLAEQNRHEEAAHAIAQALPELAAVATDARGIGALAAAALEAAQISKRDERFAEAELAEAALQIARLAGNRDLEVDALAMLARNAADRGEDARDRLRTGIARLTEAHHPAAPLWRLLGDAQLARGDAQGALASAEQGLASLSGDEWAGVQLHLVRARALRKLGRDPGADLAQALETAAKDPDFDESADLLGELALSARTADDLALPLDKLRAADLGVPSAGPGWSAKLPRGTCVDVIVGKVEKMAGVDCAETWTFASDFRAAPLQVTSLSRFLAPDPPQPRSALFVTAQTTGDVAAVATALPGADRELSSLRSFASVTELSGERATPDEALRLAPGRDLLHFAVHGFGFLQLAGEGGRLSARDIAQAKLPHARVVLSSCESDAPGPRGVAWAFARAGAAEIAAARGDVDDAAAARWSQAFYAALARGAPFAQAAREAEKDGSAARFVVLK